MEREIMFVNWKAQYYGDVNSAQTVQKIQSRVKISEIATSLF